MRFIIRLFTPLIFLLVMLVPAGAAFPAPADSAGPSIYIADLGNSRVVEVAPDGTQTTIAAGLVNPHGVAVDTDGNVYIAEAGTSQVVKVAPDGTQTTVGTGLPNPQGVAVDADGNVYIADARINVVVKVAPDGTQTTVATGLSIPLDVAVDADGNVYIADTFNNRVIKVAPDGAQTTVAAGLSTPFGVAVDTDGNVYIADTFNNRVVKVAPDGSQAVVGAGLNLPTAVAVGPAAADAATLLTDLRADVQGVGPGTSLGDKVAAAQTSLASSDAAGVCATMNAFINEVQALTGKKIPALQAEELIADAGRIQAMMAC